MKPFSTPFYALVAYICVIISLAISISASHAQKAALPDASKAAKQPSGATHKLKKPRCLPLVSVEYQSMSGRPHKLNTIRAWRKKVTTAHGAEYRHWSISQKHQVNCSGTGRQQKCTASAHPCRVIKWEMKKPVKQDKPKV